MSARGRELIAANEPAVVAKPLLDPIVVENGQGNGGLADSACTNESNWGEALGEIDHLLDQYVASKHGPGWRRRRLSRCARFKYQILDPTGSLDCRPDLGLSNCECPFDDEWNMANVTHRLKLTVSPVLTFQHVPANIGDYGVGVHNVVMKLRNDGVGIHNFVVNARNSHVCVYCELSLGMNV